MNLKIRRKLFGPGACNWNVHCIDAVLDYFKGNKEWYRHPLQTTLFESSSLAAHALMTVAYCPVDFNEAMWL